jgi:hypothetical protein
MTAAWGADQERRAESAPRMLAPRPTKLRSQRDINLWRVPLQLSLAAASLFGITLIPDILDKYGIIRIRSWLTMGSIDDARAILSAMMGAVATVLALIFSVALLVLSMVSTLFGPRLLYRFLQDWVTQVTIGIFMGTFVYICLVFLVTHQDSQSSFIPQISLITSWVLVVLSFGFLVYYSHRVARSIQNPDMIAAIRLHGGLRQVKTPRHLAGRGTFAGFPQDLLESPAERRFGRQLLDLLHPHPAFRTSQTMNLHNHGRSIYASGQVPDLPFPHIMHLVQAATASAALKSSMDRLSPHP